jgi:hypothetical protein
MLKQLKDPDHEFKLFMEAMPKNYNEFIEFYNIIDRKKLEKTLFYKNYIEKSDIYVRNLINFFHKTSMRNKEIYSKYDIIKAYCMVGSRDFGVTLLNENKKYIVLAAYADLFNYRPDPNTFWTDVLSDESKNFNIVATRDIKIGEEIFVQYGPKNNFILLSTYGFTIEKNPHRKEARIYIKIDDFFFHMDIVENDSTTIIGFIQYINKIKIRGIESSMDKKIAIKRDLKIFELILQELSRYDNSVMINNIRNNLNESKNNINILRILIDEEKLIKINIIYLNMIIEILNGGKEKFENYIDTEVVRENLSYFNELFMV